MSYASLFHELPLLVVQENGGRCTNASKKRSRRIKSLKAFEREELEDRKAQAVDGMVQRMIQEAETADEEEDWATSRNLVRQRQLTLCI